MCIVQWVDVPQGRVACWAAGNGPAVLFIHGVGTTGAQWFGDLQALASSYRLIVHNRRGYAESSPSPPEWIGHRDDAAALLAGMGVQRAAVIGYSAGASVALDLALQEPQLARIGSLSMPVAIVDAKLSPP